MEIYRDLAAKNAAMAVIGLGYVGLPVALAFSRKLAVIAFDENPQRIATLKQDIDTDGEQPAAAFSGCDILFTADEADINKASFFLIAVPTPVDINKVPDLSNLQKASKTVATYLKKGDYVVYESTVYPGCTEEECVPILESVSGLRCGIDFKVGYSPERINPGDKVNRFASIVKVVSGCDDSALAEIACVYALVVSAGVHRAPSIKVAEAAKIAENTQRDLNISLMNELSVIFDKMGINTQDVLEAAATKWNFMPFTPGLVGGHCVDVDPYYLTYKASQLGYQSKVIAAACSINDSMAGYVANKVASHVRLNAAMPGKPRILVFGATFKENVSDIRNSKVLDLVKELSRQSLEVDFVDCFADPLRVKQMYGLTQAKEPGNNYDAVILAVAHDQYKNFTEEYLLSITHPNALFADLKGIYRNKFSSIRYWSL